MEAVTAPREAPALDSPELFVNRELSWLQFNERVLELAEDERTPLLERVKFLAIYANNLDEFFMVRVAGLHDQVDAGIDARGPDGLSARETLERVAELDRELGRRHSRAWESVRPALAEEGIRVIDVSGCSPEELETIDRLFAEQIFPVLTPLAVGPGRPFPYISNLSLSIGVFVRDPDSGLETFARVKVPKEMLPRFVPTGDGRTFVPLEDLIACNLDALFPGMEIVDHSVFRVTRDADFTVSDEADDLVRAVENELRRRRFGEVVRLEVGTDMDPDLRNRLIEWLHIEERQVYDVHGFMDLGDLWDIYGLEGHRELRDPPWTPVTQARLHAEPGERPDLFAAIRTGDLIVHHPYDSFATSVERFIKQAVDDPDVLAIKMTVYRTSGESALIPS